jgi:ribosomal protein S27E
MINYEKMNITFSKLFCENCKQEQITYTRSQKITKCIYCNADIILPKSTFI